MVNIKVTRKQKKILEDILVGIRYGDYVQRMVAIAALKTFIDVCEIKEEQKDEKGKFKKIG